MSDQSSFASILAGVQRMRDEAGGSTSNTPSSTQSNFTSNNTLTEQPSTSSGSHGSTVSAGSSSMQNRGQPKNGHTSISQNSSARNEVSSGSVNRVSSSTSRSAAPVQTYSAIQVSSSQKGNPLFKNSQMKTSLWVFNPNILCDYYINPTLQILFLSLKYHKLHPEYIWQRLKKINGGTSVATTKDRVLKILLTVVDIDLPQETLRQLLDFCVKHDLLLVLAWSFEEAGNYIYFAKQHELSALRQSGALIKGLQSDDYKTSLLNSLTSVPWINKTDVVNLLANYKSFDEIVNHCCEDIDTDKIQGLGAKKRSNLKLVFTEPFIYNRDYGGNENLI